MLMISDKYVPGQASIQLFCFAPRGTYISKAVAQEKLKEQKYKWSQMSQQRCDFLMKGYVHIREEANILIRDYA